MVVRTQNRICRRNLSTNRFYLDDNTGPKVGGDVAPSPFHRALSPVWPWFWAGVGGMDRASPASGGTANGEKVRLSDHSAQHLGPLHRGHRGGGLARQPPSQQYRAQIAWPRRLSAHDAVGSGVGTSADPIRLLVSD